MVSQGLEIVDAVLARLPRGSRRGMRDIVLAETINLLIEMQRTKTAPNPDFVRTVIMRRLKT